ncbi:MAG TPA: IS1380 family transposase [Candidatus Wunengus sp. YC63]|uniref:IS1380 family transposase n=1 Tax=Candidatus Wunengus sp. YC63 TaxID=3367699 RepID=UPI0040273CA1
MQKVKTKIAKKLKRGLPLSIRPGHTIRLEVTNEPLTVHTGLSLHYAMAEALNIPQILDGRIHVKERESGYPESEHIMALSANAFVGGDYLDDLEALREDVAIQMAIGRKDIPDPTTAGDFCRRFSLGHILQMNKAYGEIQQGVYTNRADITEWTIDVDAKVHEVYGEKKEGASRSYNGVYSLQPLYAFVDETDELVHNELRSGNTHPGAKMVAFLRRVKRKIPTQVKRIYLRSDSACYNKEVVELCEKEGWELSITADQTGPLLNKIEALPENAWQRDNEDDTVEYAEVTYQPVGWPKEYRYLVKRKREKNKTGQRSLFKSAEYSCYAVVTNRKGNVQELMKTHAKRGKCEKRICQFTNEFLSHLPMGEFFANWVYLLCAQLAYNLSLWIRDLVLPKPYRKKHIKRIRRCIGLIASKIITNGRQIRVKISTMHRWWKDFVHAWETIPSLNIATSSG